MGTAISITADDLGTAPVAEASSKQVTTSSNGDARALRRIPIEAIRHDTELQMRQEMSEEAIEEYAERYGHGHSLPPITLFLDEAGTYWVADGFHRLAAGKRAGLDEIAAEVRVGTRRDALLFATGANAAHGLRRTNADKRRAVERLFADDEWRAWSDGRIATHCGVSDRFVSNVRRERGAGTDGPRIGADGKRRNTPRRDTPRKSKAPTESTPNGSGSSLEASPNNSGSSVDPTPNGSESVNTTSNGLQLETAGVTPNGSELDPVEEHSTPKEPLAVSAPSNDVYYPMAVPGLAWLVRAGVVVGVRVGDGLATEIVLDTTARHPEGSASVDVDTSVPITTVLDVDLLSTLPEDGEEKSALDARRLPRDLVDASEFVFGHPTSVLSEPVKAVGAALSAVGKVIPYETIEWTSAKRSRAGRTVVLVYGAPRKNGGHDVRAVALGKYDDQGRRPLADVWNFRAPNKAVFLSRESLQAGDLLYAILIEPSALGAPSWLSEAPSSDGDDEHGPEVPHLDLGLLGLDDKTSEEDE